MTKRLLPILLLLAAATTIHAQEFEPGPPADRDSVTKSFFLSANHSAVANSNTENRSGYGAGLSLAWPAESRVQAIVGIEYNLLRQFKHYEQFTNSSEYYNATYTMHVISQPITVRLNLGKKKQWFVEGGWYFDVATNSRVKGDFVQHETSGIAAQALQANHTSNAGFDGSIDGYTLAVGYLRQLKRRAVFVKAEFRYSEDKLLDAREDFYSRYSKISAGIAF